MNMLAKLMRKRGKGGGQILTLADEGGWGVRKMLILSDKVARGPQYPPILADITCEQPLIMYSLLGFL